MRVQHGMASNCVSSGLSKPTHPPTLNVSFPKLLFWVRPKKTKDFTRPGADVAEPGEARLVPLALVKLLCHATVEVDHGDNK